MAAVLLTRIVVALSIMMSVAYAGTGMAAKLNMTETKLSGPSPVPSDCLNCICVVESQCVMPDPVCRPDVGSLSCGPYQIKQDYWNDARLKGGDLMGSWRACTATMDCSADAVQGYMARYALSSRLGYPPTCEDFARIHNGGPNGYKNPATVGYWKKVKECLEAAEFAKAVKDGKLTQ